MTVDDKSKKWQDAKYAGYIQTAMYLLKSPIKEYIKKIIKQQLPEEIEIGDFSKSLYYIKSNWKDTFSQHQDVLFLKIIKDCIAIRNQVSHQDLYFDRSLERLVQLANRIGCQDVQEYVDSIFNEPEQESNQQSVENSATCKIKQWTDHKDKGNEYYKEGNWAEAISEYNKAIFLEPNQSILYSNRALCEINLGKYELAKFDAEEAIHIDSKNVKFYRILSDCLIKLELFQDAINACNEGLKLDPNDETLTLRKNQSFKSIQTQSIVKATQQLTINRSYSALYIDKIIADLAKKYQKFSKMKMDENEIQKIDNITDLTLFINQYEFVNQAEKYRLGLDGYEMNPEKSLEMYKNAAKLGNAEALFNLGIYHRVGEFDGDVDLDFDEMDDCFQKCISQKPYICLKGTCLIPNVGVAQAHYALADLYEKGIGKELDYKKAYEHYLIAEKYGLSRARYNIGCFLLKGQGVEKNLTLARSWFQKAADEDGIPQAQMKYADMLLEGKGGSKNKQLAFDYYKKSAEQGVPDALEKMDNLSNSPALRKIFANTVLELKNEEMPDALYLIGFNTYHGANGFPKAIEKSYYYLKKASDLNHGKALDLFCDLLLFDLKKIDEAYKYLMKSLEVNLQNAPKIYFILSQLAAFGHGCDPMIVFAKICFEISKKAEEIRETHWTINQQHRNQIFMKFETEKDFDSMVDLGRRVLEYESEKNLSYESMSIVERIIRFLSDAHYEANDVVSELMLKDAINDEVIIKKAIAESKSVLNFYLFIRLLNSAIEFLTTKQYHIAFQLIFEADKYWNFYEFPLKNKLVQNLRKAVDSVDCDNDKYAMFCKLAYLYDKDFKAGIKYANRCISFFPEEAVFYRLLANLHASNDQYKKALMEINCALSLERRRCWIFEKGNFMAHLDYRHEIYPSKEITKKRIDLYEEYIKKSPYDDDKIPFAYKSIELLYAVSLDDAKNAQIYRKKAEIAMHPSIRRPIKQFPLKITR